MSRAEGLDVVFEGPFVLEVGAADAEPALAAVLLVRPPVAFDGQQLAALAAHEGLHAVLALVVSLQRPEVLEGLRARVLDVVLAPFCAAVARHARHRPLVSRLLPALQRLRPSPVLGPVAPHVHLQCLF